MQSLTPERMEPGLADGASDQRERGESREAAIARMRAIVYPAMERLITEDPGQWVSALSNVWGAPSGPAGSAPEANQSST